jgi:hypothetical protein
MRDSPVGMCRSLIEGLGIMEERTHANFKTIYNRTVLMYMMLDIILSREMSHMSLSSLPYWHSSGR